MVTISTKATDMASITAHVPRTTLSHSKKMSYQQIEKGEKLTYKGHAPSPLVRTLSHDRDCKKNPGHKYFIPINKLNESNLDPEFRCREWVDFIQLKAHETVKLEVAHTSPDRPKDLGFNEYKGTHRVRHGSGTVFVTNMEHQQLCPFHDCPIRGEHKVSGAFKVMTAYHIVFNEEETLHTKVLFFYDEETSRPIEARGLRISSVNPQRNRAVIECITHDLTLCNKLRGFREKRMNLLKSLPKEIATSSEQTSMVVMISHPHGHAKHVTVGSLVTMVKDLSSVPVEGVHVTNCVVSYTTPTCPGSGGGSVNVLCPQRVCIGFAPHCARGEKSNEGISGLGWALA